MKTKIITIFTILFISSLTLSACTQTDKLKTEVLDKVVEVQNIVNDKVDQKVTEEKIEGLSDEELLNQLSVEDTSIDADLKALETDLQ
jgi:hypothetical protein